jgi:exonuclease SbcC
MIIKTLTLKNYRKFKNAVIEFPDGVTGVIGLNGVGKSTIFEALAWVLYGSVAARTPADQIKRDGADKKDSCRVELEFIFEGDTYRVIREMSGKNLTPSATALVNSKIVAKGAGVVSKFIQNRLGMDFKSFYTSIFAKQKELNALSSMNASERRPLILKMLGIDSLDEIIKEINSDKRNKLLLIEKLTMDLFDSNGKDKIKNLKDVIKNFEIDKKETIISINQIKEKIQKTKKFLDIQKKEYDNNKKEYEKINIYNEQLDERKTQYENKKKLQEEILKLNNKTKERQKTIDTLYSKLTYFKDISKEINNVITKINEIEKKKYNIIKKIEQNKTLLKSTKSDFEEINSKKDEIEKMGPNANCPTCDRTLGNQYNKLLEKFDKEKLKKNKETETYSKEIKTEQLEYDKTSREDLALKKKLDYLQKKQKEKEKIETTIKINSEELKTEKIDLKNKDKQLIKIGAIEFDIKEYNSVKQKVKEFYNKYQNSLDALDKKKETLADTKLLLEKEQGKKKLIIREIKNLNEKIKELRELKKQVKNEKTKIQHIKMLSEIMSSFRTNLISRIRPALSSYASDFFSRLTDEKYQEIELDEQYNLMIYDGGNPYNIERFSGGEEDLANLCLRLAISEVITERAGGLFNFIILDEIFGSQDIIRQQNIMKALNGLSSKFRQILLVTHIEDIKNHVENIILVNETEDNISRIKLE